jgi:hypothetical protein
MGEKMAQKMNGKEVTIYRFAQKHLPVTMASKCDIKVRDNSLDVDPLLLFQRLAILNRD